MELTYRQQRWGLRAGLFLCLVTGVVFVIVAGMVTRSTPIKEFTRADNILEETPRIEKGVAITEEIEKVHFKRSVEAESKSRTIQSFKLQPLYFEPNVGQTDEQVKFVARGLGYSMFLTGTEAVMVLNKPVFQENKIHEKGVEDALNFREEQLRLPHEKQVVRIKIEGGNPNPEPMGLDKQASYSNYFIGNDPAKWHPNVSHFKKAGFKDVYPGIDLVYYGNQEKLEFDFVVAPGADPNLILLEIDGAEEVSLDEEGNLILKLEGGEVIQQAPIVYQDKDGERVVILGSYVLLTECRIGFFLETYDQSYSLVIDPVIAYSTYLGGSDNDQGTSIAVDSYGAAYVLGLTYSTNFPTNNPIQATGGNYDIFVTKFNPAGSALIYSTYLGGTGNDQGNGIAVDSNGAAYVTGGTSSTDFPTSSPFQGSYGGGLWDFSVTKLNATGNALVYSTYLGGSGDERDINITVDSDGSAYVTGRTSSTDFPTSNPFQSSYGGGLWDVSVTKLNAAGSALVYSTYLGGSEDDRGFGIAVGSDGAAYVTGYTSSINFPTNNPIQEVNFGDYDVFVTKLNPVGGALVYSTYLGGSGADWGYSIAVGSDGAAYVTGFTPSTNFPTNNPIQATNAGGIVDIFVMKLNAAGSALVYSTYLGGSGDDLGVGIAVGSDGAAYVTGYTSSINFPTNNPTQAAHGGGPHDPFVMKLNVAGSALVYSTYLGGSEDDRGYGIAVGSDGATYVTGFTLSNNFSTSNPLQATFGGSPDTFVIKFGNQAPVANIESYIINEDDMLDVAAPGILSNDSDSDGESITAEVATYPSNGLISLNSNGSFTYTPMTDFHGTDSFTYRANDGNLDSIAATVTITVNPVNDAPEAENDFYTISEDMTLNVPSSGLLGNDSDVDADPLVAVKVSDPANGDLTLSNNGSFSYTPKADFHGSDSFTYMVSDGAMNSNAATVIIRIISINDAPTATISTSSISILVGQAVAFDGTGSSDPENDALTFIWTFGDESASTEMTPTHGYESAGTYQVTLTVTDTAGASSMAQVEVMVDDPQPPETNQLPRALVFVDPTITDVPATVTFDGSTSVDPDGTIIAYRWDFEDGVTRTGAIVVRKYESEGLYEGTLTVFDDAGDSASVAFNVVVFANSTNGGGETGKPPKGDTQTVALHKFRFASVFDKSNQDQVMFRVANMEANVGESFSISVGQNRWGKLFAVQENEAEVMVDDKLKYKVKNLDGQIVQIRISKKGALSFKAVRSEFVDPLDYRDQANSTQQAGQYTIPVEIIRTTVDGLRIVHKFEVPVQFKVKIRKSIKKEFAIFGKMPKHVLGAL